MLCIFKSSVCYCELFSQYFTRGSRCCFRLFSIIIYSWVLRATLLLNVPLEFLPSPFALLSCLCCGLENWIPDRKFYAMTLRLTLTLDLDIPVCPKKFLGHNMSKGSIHDVISLGCRRTSCCMITELNLDHDLPPSY